ncbi:MAG: hypothetical protein HRU11_00705 [Parvularculaceae bacterium]|nr:hypothetical protein [Parvularculaceae bacterium]
MLKQIVASAAALFLGATASAAQLDFVAFGSGTYGNSITVDGATITNTSGGNIIVGTGAAGVANGFCSLGRGCAADTEIVFDSAISNLTYYIDGAQTGDVVDVSYYDANGVLLGQTFFANVDAFIDVSGLSGITRIVFDDQNSTASGVGYSRFNFDVAVDRAIPVPAAAPLMLAGLALIARRRRHQAK